MGRGRGMEGGGGGGEGWREDGEGVRDGGRMGRGRGGAKMISHSKILPWSCY